MKADLLAALALVLIIEGLLPALNPRGWRGMVEQIAGLSDRSIRLVGMVLIIIGAAIFQFVR